MLTYSITTDFINTNTPDLDVLKRDINVLALDYPCTGVSINEDTIIIYFSGTNTPAQDALIDGVVAAHNPIIVTDRKIIETIMLVQTRKEVKNKTDWQDFGGVVVSPVDFGVSPDKILGQITGEYVIKKNEKPTTDPAEISLLETGNWNMLPDIELINPPHVLPTTNDMWLPFTAYTDVQVRGGFWSYVFRARRGKAEDFYLRHLTLSIIEVL